MAGTDQQAKWKVEAWPDGPRFVTVNGKTALSRVFHRDYGQEASALRAASQVRRRFPEADIELTRFVCSGGFWLERERATLRFCPHDNARLDWIDDMYHCPRCGDEWHDDHFASVTA